MSDRSISWTELSTFSRCKRQWYLKYHEGYKLRKEYGDVARETGTLFHRLIAHYYDPDSMEEPLQELLPKLDMLEADERSNAQKSIDMSKRMFDNYMTWLLEEKADEHIQIDEVEKKLDVEDASSIFDCDKVKLLGYVDAVGKDTRTGLPILMEHKTTNNAYTSWLGNTLLTLKWQAKFYALLLSDKSEEIDIIFNVARRVKAYGKVTLPIFWRYRILFGKREMEYARDVFSQRIRELLEFEQTVSNVTAYANPAMHCSYCDFKTVCNALDEGRGSQKNLLTTFYTTREERYGNTR